MLPGSHSQICHCWVTPASFEAATQPQCHKTLSSCPVSPSPVPTKPFLEWPCTDTFHPCSGSSGYAPGEESAWLLACHFFYDSGPQTVGPIFQHDFWPFSHYPQTGYGKHFTTTFTEGGVIPNIWCMFFITLLVRPFTSSGQAEAVSWTWDWVFLKEEMTSQAVATR